MNARPEEIDGTARAIDRIVFHETGKGAESNLPPAVPALISYLNDSFPRVTLNRSRRDRVERRLMRALHIPPAEAPGPWAKLETEMNRRIGHLDPRWTPVVGGAALVLLGVLSVAVWRQRGAVKPSVAGLR
jgi:hypothetical protein